MGRDRILLICIPTFSTITLVFLVALLVLFLVLLLMLFLVMLLLVFFLVFLGLLFGSVVTAAVRV